MQTKKQISCLIDKTISSLSKLLRQKTIISFIVVLTSIYHTSFAQNYIQAFDDSTIIKPDYRNHLNIPEYNPALMPLNRQTSSIGVWTELNPKVPRVDYLGIHFVNKDTGWAVGANGTIIKTTNGGISWTNSISNTTTPILKIRSNNGQIVIASGYGGLILLSSDGGDTFTQVISNVTGDLWGLQMINDTLGWACGNFNSLIKTTDGGQTWQMIFIPGYTSDYWWIDFLNENYGFIAGNGYVLRTTNGGINWEIIPAGDSYPLFSLDVIDSLHIAVAGYGGFNYTAKNLYSSDGGNNWITGDTLTTEAVNCIQYINPDTGYLAMTSHYYGKTTNRGQDWDYLYTPEMGEFEFQFLLNNNLGYSAGTGLSIYKTQSNYENWKPTIINDNFSDVFFINENKGFAISSFGYSYPFGLYKTENGGINWSKVPGASDGTTLLFLDSLTGFIGTNQIYKTTDGGYNWYQTNGSNGAGKIFFIDETTGWAVRSNVIYKSTDRGENWATQFTASFGFFTNICFVDSLYGWTSGVRPYKTTDGGSNWIQQTNTTIWNSDDVYFSNLDTGWIAKRSSINPSLFKTTNGGIIWSSIPITEITGAGSFCHFPDLSHWIVTGSTIQSYIIYKTYITYNNGNSWIDISSDVPSGFNSFNAVTNKLGYATGNLGLILKYNDTSYIPVELIFFTSYVNGYHVALSWKTATEINNFGFQIERLETKEEISNSWENIGYINGKGTTTEPQVYSFTDKNLSAGKYQYRLKQLDYAGTFEYSNIIEVNINVPLKFSLEQNFPNPFNPSTTITWQSPISGWQTIKLYNALGQEVEIIVNDYLEAGLHTKMYIANSTLPSGVYFYKLTIGGKTQVRKLIFMK